MRELVGFISIMLIAVGALLIAQDFKSRGGFFFADPCDPKLLDFRKPGLYRCLTQENGVKAWIRVEEEY